MKSVSDGKELTFKQFKAQTSYSFGAIERIFGSWNKALEESGLEINHQEFDEKEVRNDLINLCEEFGEGEKGVSQTIAREHGLFSTTTYKRQLGNGSWKKAIKECGYKPLNPSDWVLSGKQHPFWEGGNSTNLYKYYGPSWHKVREDVRKRDDMECRICSSTNKNMKVDVHHITPAKYWKPLKEDNKINHPRNLICLCRQCHSKLEGKFKGRNHEEFEELAKHYLDIEETEEKKGIFDY